MPQDKDPAKPPASPVTEVKRPQAAPVSAWPEAPVVAAAEAVSKVAGADGPASDPAPGWQTFFETLGARDVRVFYLGETRTAALDPSRVPLRPARAGRHTAEF